MIEEHELKGIPYGIADFKDFRIKNLYYVDKTRFIRNIEKKGSFLFFIRPRRFGKSLFLSMMEYYYDIDQKDQFDFLFNGTDIHQNPTKEKNKYLVLKFNFSAVETKKDAVERAFFCNVRDSSWVFVDKYSGLLGIDSNEVKNKLEQSQSPAMLLNLLLRYCYGKQQLYVIIDEYDNFANTILSDSGEEEYRAITHGEGFLRSFFNVIKAGTTGSDTPISRLFMTGVSPITLDDVTSGFNIASNISLDPDIAEMMGFTKNDVETIIEYYRQTGKIRHSTPELMGIMNQWYNHYKFALRSTCEVFNTVFVLYFLREYLKESRIPDQLIDNNARMDYMKLRYLMISDKKGTPRINGNFPQLRQIMESGSLHSAIVDRFPIAKLTSPGNFISLLYYFGLLTITGSDEEHKAILKIPNEAIKRLYYDYIKETYEETGILTIDLSRYEAAMKEMAFSGKWKPLIAYLVEQMETSMGIRDLITGEKGVQAFLNVYLGLSALYLVYSEKELKKGYADLVLEPFLAQYPGLKFSYLIEIKYIKPQGKKKELPPGQIKTIKKEAEIQLNKYSLDEKFRKSIGKTTLKKLVLIFSGNRMVHHSEI
ncbi:MAG: AAA family ATPase [Candidatus Aminicenantes bacterium]|nr:AAA family ATPase [Candidatus Aminicenantes bacterium]NIM82749.1 AAA family ATPase [Candidatus Aminicenantes bacterium]NIN22126.1 AAA family ATPase [Candidatus Aminicenantes bacterium]NIN45885.1 AAA family ATPase [Candidatus Aminicenantes bacterium]NIN88722.1 AAA family ATPase [Candidatus Aminicenantes bacterium]